MEENNKALLILNYLSFKDIILSLVQRKKAKKYKGNIINYKKIFKK